MDDSSRPATIHHPQNTLVSVSQQTHTHFAAAAASVCVSAAAAAEDLSSLQVWTLVAAAAAAALPPLSQAEDTHKSNARVRFHPLAIAESETLQA